MEKSNLGYECELNLGDTELRLGLPGCDDSKTPSCVSNAMRNKRAFLDMSEEMEEHSTTKSNSEARNVASPAKTQVVGWPPIRSYRKNTLQTEKDKGDQSNDGTGLFVKVSMDGAPYLRKIGLEVYKSYPELLKALQNRFQCTFDEYSEREGYHGSEYVPTYEDKDGDWMLIGDVPWDMFITSCKRLRIMRASEAKGLDCSRESTRRLRLT